MQATVASFNEDLVKFAKLGCETEACPVKSYRALFDSCTTEILIQGSENWIPLKDITDLPYSVPLGLSYRRFLEFRAEHVAAGLQDPVIKRSSLLLKGYKLQRNQEVLSSQ